MPSLFIDNWEIKKVDETKTGVQNLTDVNTGQVTVDVAEHDKYLGDILSNTGKNTKNILARKAKGHGIIDKVMKMLGDMCFGPYQLEVAFFWRDSLFLNGILTNSEAWYGLTSQDVNNL